MNFGCAQEKQGKAPFDSCAKGDMFKNCEMIPDRHLRIPNGPNFPGNVQVGLEIRNSDLRGQ